MATVLAATCTAGIAAGAAAAEVTPAPASETAQVYLMPGTWYDAAAQKTKKNSVEGLTALNADEKETLHLEEEANVYKAGAAGTTLPVPKTDKKDAKGAAFVFQGWWYIKDAAVTYTETVPEVTATTYLYADFRAKLSQRHDPVAPSETVGVGDKNFMEVMHEDGTTDYFPLLVSGSDSPDITMMGYGVYVQFSNDYFELRRNDRISVYLTDVSEEGGDEEPTCYPKPDEDGEFNRTLEANGSLTNRSLDYLCVDDAATEARGKLTFAYIPAKTMTFRVYFKISSKSGNGLNVYIEPKA